MLIMPQRPRLALNRLDPPTFGATKTFGDASLDTTTTVSHTVDSGTDLLIVIGAGGRSSPPAHNAATWDSLTMTAVGSQVVEDVYRLSCWKYENPTAKTANVVFDWGSSNTSGSFGCYNLKFNGAFSAYTIKQHDHTVLDGAAGTYNYSGLLADHGAALIACRGHGYAADTLAASGDLTEDHSYSVGASTRSTMMASGTFATANAPGNPDFNTTESSTSTGDDTVIKYLLVQGSN